MTKKVTYVGIQDLFSEADRNKFVDIKIFADAEIVLTHLSIFGGTERLNA